LVGFLAVWFFKGDGWFLFKGIENIGNSFYFVISPACRGRNVERNLSSIEEFRLLSRIIIGREIYKAFLDLKCLRGEKAKFRSTLEYFCWINCAKGSPCLFDQRSPSAVAEEIQNL
jgi:hypothetical protein